LDSFDAAVLPVVVVSLALGRRAGAGAGTARLERTLDPVPAAREHAAPAISHEPQTRTRDEHRSSGRHRKAIS
jgi:hypothetical protein